MLVGAVLRYLAVAHFGRGRGNYVEGEAPPFWQAEVEAVLAAQGADLPALWRDVRAATDSEAALAPVRELVSRVTDATLARLYPDAAPQLGLLAAAKDVAGTMPPSSEIRTAR
ncbi:hypothetical protein [Massilia sp. Dwa41.01b]|uniref:hypothetical protein n=1 Tax=Massilia sp. Dwa41.01b TaxID=2709302 RepID=UPI00280624AE|nr:hypothetical protein [Massilia sp. Dwa41.01b]